MLVVLEPVNHNVSSRIDVLKPKYYHLEEVRHRPHKKKLKTSKGKTDEIFDYLFRCMEQVRGENSYLKTSSEIGTMNVM